VKEIYTSEVNQICNRHGIAIKDLNSITGSFDKKLFFINHAFLLRISVTSMAGEQARFRRVATLDFVPRIQQVGVLEGEAGPLYYTLLTSLPGADFVHAYPETTLAQQKQLGQDLAGFLDHLHTLTGTTYDIGLYVPLIPNFTGTWQEGHQTYWERLKQATAALELKPDSRELVENAFQFLAVSSAALDYQAGSKLLHNDLHPQNILLDHGRFSGVIDWECSQFGEADFELCHLIHWCLYPPQFDLDFRPFLGAFFQASPQCTQVPGLAERLTIYQIEHELQQLIWQGSRAEAERMPRLKQWLEGGVADLLSQI